MLVGQCFLRHVSIIISILDSCKISKRYLLSKMSYKYFNMLINIYEYFNTGEKVLPLRLVQ